MARSGSNILWNIIGSHPDIVISLKETGQIFPVFNKKSPYYIVELLKLYKLFHYKPIRNLFGNLIDKHLYRYKLFNLMDVDHKYKTPDHIYNPGEIDNSILCIKSLDQQIYLTQYLNKIFPEVYNIGLVRDGYALCNGYTRRGMSASQFGTIYRKYINKIISDSKKLDNYHIVKFENMIKAPFETAKEIFQFLNLNPVKIEHIRLKSKKTISYTGQHHAKYGKENLHYWFNSFNIDQIINPEINSIQNQSLSKKQIQDFEEKAKPVLDYLSYQK